MIKLIGIFDMFIKIRRFFNKHNVFVLIAFIVVVIFFSYNFLQLDVFGAKSLDACSRLKILAAKPLSFVHENNKTSQDMMIKQYDEILRDIHLCSGEDFFKDPQFLVSLFNPLKGNVSVLTFLDRLSLHFENFDRKTKLVFVEHFFGVVHWTKDKSLKRKFRLALVEDLSKNPTKQFEYLHIVAVLDSSGKH